MAINIRSILHATFRSSWRRAALGLVAVLLEIALAGLLLPRASGLTATLSLLIAAGIFYLTAVAICLRRPPQQAQLKLRWILLAGLVFRVSLLPLAPNWSHAAWRSQWDGKVQEAGINPYAYAPNHALLLPMRAATDRPGPAAGVGAFHPPAGELLFRWNYEWAHGLRAEKLLWVACDLGLILLLARVLAARGRPREWALIYAWSPLAVFEVAGNGHMEPAAALLALLALHWLGKRPRGSAIAAAAAALTQWYALALVPLVLAGARRRSAGAAAWMLAGGALATLPFLLVNKSLTAGLIVRNAWARLAAMPSFNASVFALLQSWFGKPIAWAAAAGLVAALITVHAWKHSDASRSDPLRAALGIVAAIILVMPHVQPWNVLWLLPLLAVFPEPPWLYFSVAVLLAYGLASHPHWIWAEYVPLFAGLAWQAWQGRRVPAAVASSAIL